MHRRLVVVGGAAAGMSAASAARRIDPQLEIVVLEAGGYAAYGMCGLPYYLSGVVPKAQDLLAYPPAYFREQRRLDLRLRARVTRIDAEHRTVHFREDGRDARLDYHRLIVTAGAAPAIPPLPGLDDPWVFTVRTLEDAIRLRSLLDAGHIGRAARGVQVTLAETLPAVMANLDPPMSALVEQEVCRHGVDLRLGTSLEQVRRTAGGLKATLGGPSTAFDVVVIAVGIVPGSGVAAEAGAATGPGRALLVDDQMRTSLPDVFAAGVCIAPFHRVLGRPAFVPLGPAANKTGRVAGTVDAGGSARFAGIVGTAVVKGFDLGVAGTGLTLTQAIAEGLPAVATDAIGKSRAKYYPGSAPVHVRLVHETGGRLLGAQLTGDDTVAKRIDVLAVALQAGFDVADLAELDLSYAPPYAPVYEPVLLAAQAATASTPALPPRVAPVADVPTAVVGSAP